MNSSASGSRIVQGPDARLDPNAAVEGRFNAALALGPKLLAPPPRSGRWWWRRLERLKGISRRLTSKARADRARSAGEWELAARFYRDALDLDRGDPKLWAQCGHALKQAGKASEAELAYQRSDELNR